VPISTAAKAVKAGRIDRLPNKRIDPEAADRAWLQRTRARVDGRAPLTPAASEATDPAAPRNALSTKVNGHAHGPRGRATAPPRGSVAEAQRALLLLRAKREAMELKVKSGEYISAKEARTVAFAVGRRTRDLLMGMSARLAASLEMRPAEDITRMLNEELQHVCEEVSRWAKL
jgi:hypothetical protein